MTFEIFRTKAKQWRWRLRASNGRIIANSGEAYRRHIDCMRSVERTSSSNSAPIVEVSR